MVGQVHHKVHVVLNQQHAHAFRLQFFQQLRQLLFFLIAQARRRLVQQQQAGIAAQRARDFQYALLSQRQAAGLFMQHGSQAYPFQLSFGFQQQRVFQLLVAAQHAGDHFADVAMLGAQVGAYRDVFQHCHGRQQAHMLEGAAYAQLDDLARRQAADLLQAAVAEETYRARSQGQHAGHQVEHRRLAGAVRSYQPDDLSGADLELHVVDGQQSAELLARQRHFQYHLAAGGFVAVRQSLRGIRDRDLSRCRQPSGE